MSILDLAAAVIEQAVYDAAKGPLIAPQPGTNELIDAVAAWIGVEPHHLFNLINCRADYRRRVGMPRRNIHTHARVFSDQTRLKISQGRARYEARRKGLLV